MFGPPGWHEALFDAGYTLTALTRALESDQGKAVLRAALRLKDTSEWRGFPGAVDEHNTSQQPDEGEQTRACAPAITYFVRATSRGCTPAGRT